MGRLEGVGGRLTLRVRVCVCVPLQRELRPYLVEKARDDDLSFTFAPSLPPSLPPSLLRYRGKSNGKDYECHLEFLRSVKKEGSVWKVLPRSIQILLQKEDNDTGFWERLLKDKKLEKTNVKVRPGVPSLPLSLPPSLPLLSHCTEIILAGLQCISPPSLPLSLPLSVPPSLRSLDISSEVH